MTRRPWLLLFLGVSACSGAGSGDASGGGGPASAGGAPSGGSSFALGGADAATAGRAGAVTTPGGGSSAGGASNTAGASSGGNAAQAGSGGAGPGGGAAQAGAGGGSAQGGSGGIAASGGGSSGGASSGGSTSAGGRAGATSGGAGSAGSASGGMPGSGGGTTVDPNALPAITLHLAGDSTVMTYAAGSAQEGWGQELGSYFIAKLTINNQAIGGASVQSFYESTRWTNITGRLKAGDYVMAAFGANDSGSVEGRHVEPAAFGDLFGKMADEVKAKSASFVLVTPSALQQWSGTVEGNQRLRPYCDALKALSGSKMLPLDDLNARSVEYLNAIGPTAAAQIYINGDKAHFTKKGAVQMALFVAQELSRIQSPLAAYLKPLP